MIVMACVQRGETLDKRWPGRIGLMFTPNNTKAPRGLPFAVDNGAYLDYLRQRPWNEAVWLGLLDKLVKKDWQPLWVVVPDVICNASGTLKSWDKWAPRLRKNYPFPLALAMQNGVSIQQARNCEADVIFVGGGTYHHEWKWRAMQMITKAFPRVHVGRINTSGGLWTCHELGVESVDGSGWFRCGDHPTKVEAQRKLNELYSYLDRSSQGLGRPVKGFKVCK